jgi:N6-adenosine-specific RNA methylase IME4
MEKYSILNESLSMERSFIHHKTGEVSIMKTERIGSNSIVPEARMLLRETDAIEDRREMRLLRTMEPEKQVKVASLIASGEAHTLRDATRRITTESIHEMTLAECVAGKFSVIYADPPWNYGNSGLDEYGHAERHYKTMLTNDICELPVGDYTATNAVLFLWATSPLLPDALRVIEGWGFEYKTSFVWDKVKHNFGHYNSVRHEFLLVGVKGSYTPESKELHDSVVELERTERHSAKPQYFRELIEGMYPSGSKLELFAREENENWTVWGNQVKGVSNNG